MTYDNIKIKRAPMGRITKQVIILSISRRLFKKRFINRIISRSQVSRDIAMHEFNAVIEDLDDMKIYEDPEYYADECMYCWND